MRVSRLAVLVVVLLCSLRRPIPGQGITTSQDQRHGSAQLQQLLLDRPDMQGLIPHGTAVNTWIESAFANTAGGRVYWDNRRPITGKEGEHTLAFRGYPTSVRITDSGQISPLDKYSVLIFELHNAKRSHERTDLNSQAIAGLLSEDDFAERYVTSEFHALLETQAFLRSNSFESLAREDDRLTTMILRADNSLDNYLNDLRSRADDSANELEHYKKWYRSAIGSRSN